LISSTKIFSSSDIDESKQTKSKPTNTTQFVQISADQLLNITITKTGLELVQRLSTVFGDIIHNQRSTSDIDDEQALLSIVNRTGKHVEIDQLHGLQVDVRCLAVDGISRARIVRG
jgi:hypothetical protein